MDNLTFLLLPLLSGEPGGRWTGMAGLFPNIKKSNVETAGQEEDWQDAKLFRLFDWILPGRVTSCKGLYSLRGAMDDVRTTWPRREGKGLSPCRGYHTVDDNIY